jgi:Na+-translocating ferredoxin:NAD+ oxidoreductase subunit C
MLELTIDRRLTGGLTLKANKRISTAQPISRGLLPDTLYVPLHQHRGAAALPCVSTGDRVLKGQLIGRPALSARTDDERALPSAGVHAPSSGTVREIGDRPVVLGSRVEPSPCIVIQTDGRDEVLPADQRPGWPDDRAGQLERIREGGIVGLGGAVFPTAEKLASCAPCEVLIVNGAECEPFISCDDMLMRECAVEIVDGVRLMADVLDVPLCIIAIEQDKPVAIDAIAMAARATGDERLRLADLPTIYPAGGELQLIELLTGREVPSGHYPSEIGVLTQNVGTAYALHRLVRHGEPLLSRVVTVTGGAIRTPQNVETLIGTPVSELIAHCGGYSTEPVRLILGGSMMGAALPGDDVPITKASNCIVAAARGEVRESYAEWPCIRCGECAAACPASLLPQEILRAAKAGNHEGLDEFGLSECIECGCCDAVCPSHIPLTEYFRTAKRAHARHERQQRLAMDSDQRFQQRELRRQEETRELEAQRIAMREQLRGADEDARRAAIEAALARARDRKADDERTH